jgi:hypothetical protein
MVQNWLNDHPLLAWCATHPVWAIALLFLFIFSAWGLLGAIAQLVKTLWIELLRAPFRLVRWMGMYLLNLFRPSIDKPSQISDVQPSLRQEPQSPQLELNEPELANRQNDQAAQLSQVVDRLEQLQKDQLQLIQEVRDILQQPSDKPIQSLLPTLKEAKPQKKLP